MNVADQRFHGAHGFFIGVLVNKAGSAAFELPYCASFPKSLVVIPVMSLPKKKKHVDAFAP